MRFLGNNTQGESTFFIRNHEWNIYLGYCWGSSSVEISFSYIPVYIIKNNQQSAEPSKRKCVYIVDKYLKAWNGIGSIQVLFIIYLSQDRNFVEA